MRAERETGVKCERIHGGAEAGGERFMRADDTGPERDRRRMKSGINESNRALQRSGEVEEQLCQEFSVYLSSVFRTLLVVEQSNRVSLSGAGAIIRTKMIRARQSACPCHCATAEVHDVMEHSPR